MSYSLARLQIECIGRWYALEVVFAMTCLLLYSETIGQPCTLLFSLVPTWTIHQSRTCSPAPPKLHFGAITDIVLSQKSALFAVVSSMDRQTTSTPSQKSLLDPNIDISAEDAAVLGSANGNHRDGCIVIGSYTTLMKCNGM